MTRKERRDMTTADRIAERERKGIPQDTPHGFTIPRPPVERTCECGTAFTVDPAAPNANATRCGPCIDKAGADAFARL